MLPRVPNFLSSIFIITPKKKTGHNQEGTTQESPGRDFKGRTNIEILHAPPPKKKSAFSQTSYSRGPGFTVSHYCMSPYDFLCFGKGSRNVGPRAF